MLHRRGQLVGKLEAHIQPAAWFGYMAGAHLATVGNIGFDGGLKNVFDSENGYLKQ